MTTTEALLTNGAYGYPNRGGTRRHTPHILAVVHQTATPAYEGAAMALRNQRAAADYSGNTATYYIDADGDAVHAVDGTRYAAWCSAPQSIGYVDASRLSMATVKSHYAQGFNPNECAWEQLECVGNGAEPWTDAQFATAARIIADRARASGLSITRDTVVPHRDFDTVNRPSDPWPSSTREARMARLVAAAQALVEDTPMQPLRITGEAPASVALTVGDQLWNPDGTPLVKMSGAATLPSPYEVAVGSVRHRVVRITTGGLPTLALVRVADVAVTPLVLPTLTQAQADAQAAAAVKADRAKAHVAVSWE